MAAVAHAPAVLPVDPQPEEVKRDDALAEAAEAAPARGRSVSESEEDGAAQPSVTSAVFLATGRHMQVYVPHGFLTRTRIKALIDMPAEEVLTARLALCTRADTGALRCSARQTFSPRRRAHLLLSRTGSVHAPLDFTTTCGFVQTPLARTPCTASAALAPMGPQRSIPALQVLAMMRNPDNSGIMRTLQAVKHHTVLSDTPDETCVYAEHVARSGPRFMRRTIQLNVAMGVRPRELCGEFFLAKPGGLRTYEARF